LNLPNALSFGRIAATPLIAILPFANSSGLRLTAFILFVVAAVTDYIDGYLARSRKQETDLGRLLDPFADKALLVGTLVPMYILAKDLPFVTLWGPAGLPLWIVLVVLGREIFMTVFRQAAARRGVVIAAIGVAKWKTGFQLFWQGAAYCWFWTYALATEHRWQNEVLWRDFALFNGTVGTLVMMLAVVLTIYSLVIYLRSFGRVFATAPSKLP
jgi:CDP-diacylglycerol--glycerol-3-phosphate 3-phosphatidyltransferase